MLLSRWAALMALVCSLAGCGGSQRVAYDLQAATPTLERAPRAVLRIRQPTTTVDLDSDRILVRGGSAALSVMAGAQWADLLPLLLRSRLTATFQNARGLRAVADDAVVANDIDVQTDVRAFELDAAAKQVDVEIRVKLVSTANGRAVATRLFTTHAPVDSTEPAAVAAALDHALSGVMVEIVKFVAASV